MYGVIPSMPLIVPLPVAWLVVLGVLTVASVTGSIVAALADSSTCHAHGPHPRDHEPPARLAA